MRNNNLPNVETIAEIAKVRMSSVIEIVPSANKDRTWRVQTSFAFDGRIVATSGRLVRNHAVA